MSTVLYLIPRTAVLGAILLIGYLGGAVATHVRRTGGGLFEILFPVIFATIVCAHLFHLRIVLSIFDSRIGTHFPCLALISAHRVSRFALPSGVSQ